MDAKLKALKVAELKAIIAKAGISAPAKATKADLIAKIQASEAGLAAYSELHQPDDLLAPPESLDWPVDNPKQPTPPPAEPPKPVSPAPAAAATEAPKSDVDPEFERLKQRAARFGIPLVEKKPKEKASQKKSQPAPPAEVDEKLKARAARFGTAAASTAASTAAPNASRPSKRAAQDAPDAEELERRKKRAERFGIPLKS